MPAPKKRHYTAQDIMEILSIGKTKAYEIIHECERRGIVFRDKGTLRVEIAGFEAYCAEHKNAQGQYEHQFEVLISEGHAVLNNAPRRRGRPRKEAVAL